MPLIQGPQPPPGDAGEDAAVTSIRRQQARSGIGYSDPVELSRTRQSRVDFWPWYIPHRTRPTALKGKITQQVRKHDPEWGDQWVEKQSISLEEEAVARLRRALEAHAAVAGESEVGTFLLIRDSDVAPAAKADAAEVVRAVVGLLGQSDVLSGLAREELSAEIVLGLQGSLRVQELRLAVRELRGHLEAGENDESVYQAWCSRHSWAFGNAHTTPDDLRRMNRTDIADILLPRVLTGHRDIVELKRPDHPVIRSGKSWFWSAETSMAIGQCREYMDNLHEDASSGLRGRRDIVAYHPRATIVIGRSGGWNTETYRGLDGLNEVLNRITVMTYDQLLAQGEELLRVLMEEQAGLGRQAPAEPDDVPFETGPDDIPF